MAHYAGLVAAGLYPSPVGIADFVTTTTHKTLRGPRGGIILAKPEHEKVLNSAIFPSIQGGPLEHVIAAKAVSFHEALQPSFKDYQRQVLANAKIMAETLIKRGLRIVSGRTESHVFLVDLRAKKVTGKDTEAAQRVMDERWGTSGRLLDGFTIGSDNTGGGGLGDRLAGAIDGLRLWTTALTAQEVCTRAGRTGC